jgi:hypothetical protein
MPESPQTRATLDAARRNVDAAIRMLFGGEDPLPVHLVAASASRALHDLAKAGRAEALAEVIARFLAPGGEEEFYRAIEAATAFAERAEQDPGLMLQDVSETRNDFEIAMACLYLEYLGAKASAEARAFLWWFAAMYPHVMKADPFFKASLPTEDFQWLLGAPRAKQLQFGDTVLRLVRRNKLTAEP